MAKLLLCGTCCISCVQLLGAVHAGLSRRGPPPEELRPSCRAEYPDGSWRACPSSRPRSELLGMVGGHPARREHSARTKDAKPMQVLAQDQLDRMALGSWKLLPLNVTAPLPEDSLGSQSRYATCNLYHGPKSEVAKEDKLLRQRPHSSAFRQKRPLCEFEYLWDSNESSATGWVTQPQAQSCLRRRWLAFWGDSTTRIAYAAMVDFLHGGIEDASFPTHDFSYDEHAEFHDGCNEAHIKETGVHCYFAVEVPQSQTALTFTWATRMDRWKSLQGMLAKFADHSQFPDLDLQPVPDLLLVNSGPWEGYHFGNSPGWMGNQPYSDLFRQFLLGEWQDLLQADTTGVEPKLLMLGNTACPQGRRLLCKVDGVACTGFVKTVDQLQRQVISEVGAQSAELGASIRFFNARPLYKPLPEGYSCMAGGFHLPSIVTDQRLNHLLHGLCPASTGAAAAAAAAA